MADDANGQHFIARMVGQVPVAIWITILGWMGGGIYWAIQLDNRVTENNARVAALEALVKNINEKDTTAGQLVKERADHIERAVSWLISHVTGTPGPGPGGRNMPGYYWDPSKYPPIQPAPPKPDTPPSDPSKGPTLQSDESQPVDIDKLWPPNPQSDSK
jgi:hypothetical protein